MASRLAPLAPQPTGARPPLKVLFVCTANICRSPYMELAARAEAGDARIVFSGAGTHGFSDQPMHPPMAEALLRHHPGSQAAVEEFRSRPLTRAMVDEADLVVTAEAAHRGFVLDDLPGAFRKVFTLGQLAEAVQRLPEDLDRDEMLAALGERRGTAAHVLDVTDPYGRGSEAAEACADHIDTLLRVVVPRLVGPR